MKIRIRTFSLVLLVKELLVLSGHKFISYLFYYVLAHLKKQDGGAKSFGSDKLRLAHSVRIFWRARLPCDVIRDCEETYWCLWATSFQSDFYSHLRWLIIDITFKPYNRQTFMQIFKHRYSRMFRNFIIHLSKPTIVLFLGGYSGIQRRWIATLANVSNDQ